jgi:hypothetical protein
MAKRRVVVKQRGSPDRRGMGAPSDFIAEQFVPSEHHKAQQLAWAQKLRAAGLSSEQIAGMLTVPFDLPLGEKPKDKKPKDR